MQDGGAVPRRPGWLAGAEQAATKDSVTNSAPSLTLQGRMRLSLGQGWARVIRSPPIE